MKPIALYLFLAAAWLPSISRAAATAGQAMDERNQLLMDAQKPVAAFFSSLFQKTGGYVSGSHAFSPAAAKKLLRFNVGAVAGSDFIPIDKPAALQGVSNSQMLSYINAMPALLPVPMAGLQAHLGVPSFLIFEAFDAGVRVSALNQGFGPVNVDLSGLGLDLRGNLFEAGLVWPLTLTFTLGMDTFRGKVGLNQALTLNDSSTVPGYTATGAVNQVAETTMHNTSYTLRAVASRRFFMLVPYAGVAGQLNSGSTETRLAQTGTVTISSGPSDSATSSAVIETKSSAPMDAFELRAGAGMEILLGPLYLNLSGEYGTISKAYGADLQLGLQF